MSDKRLVEMAVKSTLDHWVGDIAISLSQGGSSANPVRAYDLDDPSWERQGAAGSEHALVYQYTNLSEEPIHPLYGFTFLVGAKTTDDTGNYGITDLLTALREKLCLMDSVDLYDYSGDADDPLGDRQGVMVITGVNTGPQMFEKQSGIRLLAVDAKVIADG